MNPSDQQAAISDVFDLLTQALDLLTEGAETTAEDQTEAES